MGRPRKRPRDDQETQAEDDTNIFDPNSNVADLLPDMDDPGMAFIQSLAGMEFDFDMPLTTPPNPLEADERANWNFGNYTVGGQMGHVNFDPAPSQTFSASNLDPNMFISSPNQGVMGDQSLANDPVPGLSTNASSPESSSSQGHPATPGSCSCTTTLYSALSSMQNLPRAVEEAVRQARTAAKTAYQVVNCPNCSFKIEPPRGAMSGATISNFQNLMLLATLIPSIVHGYETILVAVDEEVQRARERGQPLVFKIHQVGGVWGLLGANSKCGSLEAYEHREMDPVMWRLAMRALLKTDVYGLSDGNSCDPFHLGLKDIVNMMESKSKARHAVMDAMVDSGVWTDERCQALRLHKHGETPTCQKIIALARTSIDQLIIP